MVAHATACLAAAAVLLTATIAACATAAAYVYWHASPASNNSLYAGMHQQPLWVGAAASSSQVLNPNPVQIPPAYVIAAQAALATATGYKARLLKTLLDMHVQKLDNRTPVIYALANATTVAVYPISFSIPEEYVQRSVPDKQRGWSSVIPGNRSTYKFLVDLKDLPRTRSNEARYLQDMQQSLFCPTFKKQGWDCLRHLEILASGCLPVMPDVQAAPRHTMAAYPKAVMQELLHFPGMSYVWNAGSPGSISGLQYDSSKVDRQLYLITVAALLDYTQQVLTTGAMAAYVLHAVGIPAPTSVLFLASSEAASGDYQGDTLLHGFKVLLGQGAVVDYARRTCLYKDQEHLEWEAYTRHKAALYGGGFTFGATISELPGVVNRTLLQERVAAQEFDLIVFAQAHRKEQPLFNEVCRAYGDSKRVAAVFGGDYPLQAREVNRFVGCAHWFFARELDAGASV